MNSQADVERAQDLERRLCAYEELEGRTDWPGAMGVGDYLALAVFALVVVVAFYLWGGHA